MPLELSTFDARETGDAVTAVAVRTAQVPEAMHRDVRRILFADKYDLAILYEGQLNCV